MPSSEFFLGVLAGLSMLLMLLMVWAIALGERPMSDLERRRHLIGGFALLAGSGLFLMYVITK